LTARQESGKAPDGSFILSVLAKRTYALTGDGQCVLAAEQLPLCEEPQFDPKDPALLIRDTDLFPFKPRSDVIIHGHAYNYTGGAQFHAAVRIGEVWKQLLVVGDRQCALGTTGAVLISKPEPLERVPLSYTHAYGGRDTFAEALAVEALTTRWPDVPPEMLPTEEASAFLYPRNPSG